jgi:hypothetical protein
LYAASESRLRPLIAKLAKRAPELDGWTVHDRLTPLAFEAAVERARVATGLDLCTARARAGFTRGHLLDLVVYSPRFGAADDPRARRATRIACEALLGDRIFDDWIGAVELAQMPRGGPLRVLDGAQPGARSAPLAELAPAVNAAIDGLMDGLPADACHTRARSAKWTLFETEPERADDWVAQDDLVMATTMLPEMLKSFLQGAPFFSGRFSRSGECFCYLKLDTGELDPEERLSRRSALEDALDEALVPRGLGCVVGNGLGVRYSYLDLALTDCEAAIERTRAVVRELGCPKRGWLLFCDAELADEWLGVWPDSPAPPGF